MDTATQNTDWGSNISLVCGADFRFLPGAIALFNSALLNGFLGDFILLIGDDAPDLDFMAHERLRIVRHLRNPQIFGPAEKLGMLSEFPPGKYLLLDADFIIERPCGYLLEPIEKGLLVSTEAEPKYDPFDVYVYHQSRELALPYDLPPYPYVNSGFLGFSVPRDQELLQRYAQLTQAHLKDVHEVFAHPCFKFPEQDILNLLIRKHRGEGHSIFSVSTKNLELGAGSMADRERPFPHTSQKGSGPADQLKFFIHGASLRRPWIMPPNWLETRGIAAYYRRMRHRLHPYERAWAFYTCSRGLAIPLEQWSGRYGFTAHKHRLWRRAYGLI